MQLQFLRSLRSLVKHWEFTLINIIGLSIGIASCLLLYLYIVSERNYDTYQEDARHLYRLYTGIVNDDGEEVLLASTSPPIIHTMLEELPEVVAAARVVRHPEVDKNLVTYENKTLYIDKVLIVDPAFFDLFTYPFEEGNTSNPLPQRNTIVLNHSTATRIFGNERAVGKVITIGTPGSEENLYTVTGVVDDRNIKSHIVANLFISMSSPGLGDFVRETTNWAGQNFIYSYFRLAPNASVSDLEEKLPEFLARHGGKDLAELSMKKYLYIQPVTAIHEGSNMQHEISANVNLALLKTLITIALIILTIACVNYINLSTAMANKRAREVGIRRTLGADRSDLIRLFMGESLATVCVSVFLAILLVELLLPRFSNLIGKHIEFEGDWWGYLLFISLLIVTTTFLAGSYPSFYLSSIRPMRAIGSIYHKVNGHSLLRKSLVVFQFTIATVLILGVLITTGQLRFMENGALGFASDNTLIVPLRTSEASGAYPELNASLSSHSEIRSVAASSVVPGGFIAHNFDIYPSGSTMSNAMHVERYFSSPSLLETLGLHLIAGRAFDSGPERENDNRIIVNEHTLSAMGIAPDDAIGRKVYTEWEGATYEFEITGVIDNFHQVSLKEPISSIIIHPGSPGDFDYMLVKYNPARYPETLKLVKDQWQTLVPDVPFEYDFLDRQFASQYDKDRKISTAVLVFAVIAILISSLGLYGLSVFIASSRVKEIGIRKTLGATSRQVFGLLSRDYLVLVIIAFVLGIPLALYLMKQWLENFAYHITAEPIYFLLTGAILVMIAWLTISFHVIRACRVNPIDTLRTE